MVSSPTLVSHEQVYHVEVSVEDQADSDNFVHTGKVDKKDKGSKNFSRKSQEQHDSDINSKTNGLKNKQIDKDQNFNKIKKVSIDSNYSFANEPVNDPKGSNSWQQWGFHLGKFDENHYEQLNKVHQDAFDENHYEQLNKVHHDAFEEKLYEQLNKVHQDAFDENHYEQLNKVHHDASEEKNYEQLNKVHHDAFEDNNYEQLNKVHHGAVEENKYELSSINGLGTGIGGVTFTIGSKEETIDADQVKIELIKIFTVPTHNRAFR